MVLADGGNISLPGRSDTFTTAKSGTLGVGPTDLVGIVPSDFEVIEPYGPLPNVFSPTPPCSLDDNPLPTDVTPVPALRRMAQVALILSLALAAGYAARRGMIRPT